MIDDQTFVLPFTSILAYNGANTEFPADGSQIIKFEVYQELAAEFIEIEHMVETVKLDPYNSNRLMIELSQAVPYGSKIRITVREGKLKNAETNDIQASEQVTASEQSGQGFIFKFDQESIPLELKHEIDPADSYQNIQFFTLGYHIPLVPGQDNWPDITISKVCPGDGNEGGETLDRIAEETECYPYFENNIDEILLLSMIQNKAEVKLNTSYFKSLEPALYQVRVSFKDDNGLVIDGHIDININVRQPNPPVALSNKAHMTDAHTLILPFSTSLKMVPIPANPAELLVVDVYNGQTEFPVLASSALDVEIEGGEPFPPYNSVEVLDVAVDSNDPTQLIVTLKNDVEYGSLVTVYVNPNSLLDADTLDLQEAPQFFSYIYRSELSDYFVRFIHKSPQSADVEIMINTRGNQIGELSLIKACYPGDITCTVYESPSEFETGYELIKVGQLIKLTLKGAYFSNEDEELRSYWLTIPIMKNEVQIDELYIEIMVDLPSL